MIRNFLPMTIQQYSRTRGVSVIITCYGMERVSKSIEISKTPVKARVPALDDSHIQRHFKEKKKLN